MTAPTPDDLLNALAEFVSRVDLLDPQASTAGEFTVGLQGRELRVALRGPVARTACSGS